MKRFYHPDALISRKAIADRLIAQPIAPEETLPCDREGYNAPIVTELDVKEAGINSLIWAGGYKFDFSWIHLPVLDGDGFPIQQRGVCAYPGLYFLGLPWLHTPKSGLLLGVGEDAAYIASQIAGNK